MSDIDFLKDLFETRIYNGEARFVIKPGSFEKMGITPESILMSTEFDKIDDLLHNKKNKEVNMSDLCGWLNGLKDRYETFNENHRPSFPVFGDDCNSLSDPIYPYPINVLNIYGVTVIVPDSSYNKITINDKPLGGKPLAIEYYYFDNQISNSPNYFFIVPKSYLDSLENPERTYYMRFFGTLTELNYLQGQFYISPGQQYSSLQEAFNETTSCFLYKQLNAHYNWMQTRNTTFLVNSEKADKHTFHSQDKPDFEFKMTSQGLKTHINSKISIEGKKYDYVWLKWDKGVYSDKFSDLGSGPVWELDLPLYRQVILDLLDKLENFYSLIRQPSDVRIYLDVYDNKCIIISPNELFNALIEKARQDKNVIGEMNNDLQRIKDEVVIQKGKIEEEFKLVPQATFPTQSVEAAVIDVIDPNQLAKDRIKELETKYGVTEFNQLEDRLCDKYPVMVHPDFLDPTYFYLRELSVDYVLPASGSLAKNSISCFYSNQAFEEAFLLGMNTEMGRELMWREYPTDQRGSYFRKFWDQTELPKKEELKKKYYDIEDIDKWKNKLGKNHRTGKSPMLVFAIKGELMQTYPDTDVYLQKIGVGGKPADEIIKQEMASWLSPDTYLVGFSRISKEDLKSYYLVFRQRPLSLQFSKESENQSNPYGIVNPQCYLMVAAQ